MNTLVAGSTGEWRDWLARHGQSEREVWLVIQHRDSATPTPRYHEAIEHALCFGWIDSQARKHDAGSSRLRFTPRNPGSTWSELNRERAARMTGLGLMTPRGQALIDLARATGTWQPAPADDLHELLSGNGTAAANFANFPPSTKRLILDWIGAAKRAETRRRRIEQTVELAASNVRAR